MEKEEGKSALKQIGVAIVDVGMLLTVVVGLLENQEEQEVLINAGMKLVEALDILAPLAGMEGYRNEFKVKE